MRDTLVKHLEGNNLINETRAVDEDNNLDVISLDFAKAFDKVPHQRLINKLQQHDLEGKVLDWIKAWLSNRQQRVSVRGDSSGWSAVTSGVPQGSVLCCF
jgi:ribonuclease P/MRP protein subunit RPP40